MKNSVQASYLLEDFEGPLDFLLHLIRKSEVDIYGVSIKEITDQFLGTFSSTKETSIDDGAEFVSDAAILMWLKSKMLLPKHEQSVGDEDLDQDPKFEIIHQLFDYCQFRDAGKALSTIEQQQSGYYFRGTESDPEIAKPLGVEHLSVDDIALMFKDALKKAEHYTGQIYEESWKVSDKIRSIRKEIKSGQIVRFMSLFCSSKSRSELIVTFLAVLELMKLGNARIVRDLTTGEVIVVPGEE